MKELFDLLDEDLKGIEQTDLIEKEENFESFEFRSEVISYYLGR